MRSDRSASLLALETSFIAGAFRLIGSSLSYGAPAFLVHLSRDILARWVRMARDGTGFSVYKAQPARIL
jgi:hypothetical protein